MRSIIVILFLLLFTISCDSTTGLEPVSGAEGTLTFKGTWDPNIKAAAVIALDGIDLENPASKLVSYSNLIDPGTSQAEYFIQLLPGTYYLTAVGITVDPGFFAIKLDSIITAEEIPLKIIDNDLRNLTSPVIISEQEITTENREIVF